MGKMIMLHPITKVKLPLSFGVFDIESQDWKNFVVAGVYTKELGFEHFGYDTGGISDFFHYIFHSKETPNVYFAHFGGRFDFLFLIEWLIRNPKYLMGNIIPRGSSILTFDVTFGGRKISFWDSFALFPFSLAKLTKSFDVVHKKGSVDFQFIKDAYDNKKGCSYDQEALLSYLESDCTGLHEVIEKFYEWPLINAAGPAFTIASQAMKVFRTFLKDSIPPIVGRDEDFIRKSYFGGRTEIIKPYYFNKEDTLNCYDANSLYPYCMRNFEFPRCVDQRGLKEYLPKRMGIWECIIRVPQMHLPPLPVKHEGKLIFPVGDLHGTWTSIEINNAIENGCEILEVITGMTLVSDGFIFKEFIDKLYDIRLKSESGSVNNLLAKLIMNSSYGKFCQSLEKEKIAWEEGKDGEKPFHTFNVDGKEVRLVTVPSVLNSFTNVAIGTFVTSYARVVMFKHWKSCGKELYYLDTDSLYTSKKFKDSTKLGKVKCEEETHEACFLLPKTYITDTKLKMKGFEVSKDDKKGRLFSFEDFSGALMGDLSLLKSNQRGGLMSFKSALRSKDAVLATKDITEKCIRSQYDKRKVVKSGHIKDWTTEPWIIKDGVIINK